MHVTTNLKTVQYQIFNILNHLSKTQEYQSKLIIVLKTEKVFNVVTAIMVSLFY